MRDARYLDARITADGREGWPVEAGRYRLVVAWACPWANRTMIVRRLLGLEPALSMGICGPEHDWRSWTFDLDPGEVDPVLPQRLAATGTGRIGQPDLDRGGGPLVGGRQGSEGEAPASRLTPRASGVSLAPALGERGGLSLGVPGELIELGPQGGILDQEFLDPRLQRGEFRTQRGEFVEGRHDAHR